MNKGDLVGKIAKDAGITKGQAEAAFKLIRASATEVVFENPQHDFPQRISYALKDGGKLTAAIEGTKNGFILKVMGITLRSHHRVMITLGMDKIGHADPVFGECVPAITQNGS